MLGSMLVEATESLLSRNVAAAGADAQVIGANVSRSGLNISNDAAGATVYLLLGSGVTSATNFDISLAAGGNWPGTVGGVVWRGAVRAFSVGSHIAVTEA